MCIFCFDDIVILSQWIAKQQNICYIITNKWNSSKKEKKCNATFISVAIHGRTGAQQVWLFFKNTSYLLRCASNTALVCMYINLHTLPITFSINKRLISNLQMQHWSTKNTTLTKGTFLCRETLMKHKQNTIDFCTT